jgi:hypothetical protein
VVNKCKTVVADQDAEIQQYQAKSALDEQIKSDQAKVIASPLHDPIKVAAGTLILIEAARLILTHSL